MTDAQSKKLDEIADRLGDLYQTIGNMDIAARDEIYLLDEVLSITQSIEAVSGRTHRAEADCH